MYSGFRPADCSLECRIEKRAAAPLLRKDRHDLHVPPAAFRANEPPMLRDMNEDHVRLQFQFIEALAGLMIAIGSRVLTMHSQSYFPGRMASATVLVGTKRDIRPQPSDSQSSRRL